MNCRCLNEKEKKTGRTNKEIILETAENCHILQANCQREMRHIEETGKKQVLWEHATCFVVEDDKKIRKEHCTYADYLNKTMVQAEFVAKRNLLSKHEVFVWDLEELGKLYRRLLMKKSAKELLKKSKVYGNLPKGDVNIVVMKNGMTNSNSNYSLKYIDEKN